MNSRNSYRLAGISFALGVWLCGVSGARAQNIVVDARRHM